MKLRESAEIYKISWKNLGWIASLHVLAIVMVFQFSTWGAVIVGFLAHYLAGMVGITFSFHRLFTHKSFKVPRWVENIGALCGTLACQGGPISWVGGHRIHHAYSDTENDPHNANEGFWYSHVLWLFNRRQDLDNYEDYKHYAPDLASRKFFVFLEKNMIFVQVLFAGVLGLIGYAIGGSWHSVWSYITWGVFVRICAGYHVTWFVNSAAHKWGSNSNQLKDLSKNNWWVSILAFGEGWHNNHHAQPRSAKHGWHWWQVDQTWIMIRALNIVGLLKEIKYPQVKDALIDEEILLSVQTNSLNQMGSSH
jgi:fatty-acid desaturase